LFKPVLSGCSTAKPNTANKVTDIVVETNLVQPLVSKGDLCGGMTAVLPPSGDVSRCWVSVGDCTSWFSLMIGIVVSKGFAHKVFSKILDRVNANKVHWSAIAN
jgi:hypothetical protein